MFGFSVEGFADSLGIGYDILVYGIGILAMLFSVVAFQFRHRFTIIFCSFLGQTSWVVHFLLQGDVTSAITCLLSAIMLGVFSKKDKWKWVASPYIIVFFIILLSAFTLLTFETWSDIFPLLAGVFAVIANSRTSEKYLRRFSVLWCLFWLMNSIFKMYPVAFLNDLFATISTIVSIIRYRKTDSSAKDGA